MSSGAAENGGKLLGIPLAWGTRYVWCSAASAFDGEAVAADRVSRLTISPLVLTSYRYRRRGYMILFRFAFGGRACFLPASVLEGHIASIVAMVRAMRKVLAYVAA